MKRWLNFTLALAALVGLAFAVQQAFLKQTLDRQYEVLVAEVGYLESTGENGVSVLALPTRDPKHFRWRIFMPAGEKVYWKNRGNEAEIPVNGPLSFVANVRFRDGENGTLSVWWGFEGTAAVSSWGGAGLYRLLDGRWGEMEVEQLAADGKIVMKPGELTSLLRIRMGGRMREEAQVLLSPRVADLYVPEFFHLQLGTRKAVDDQNMTGQVPRGLSSD